MRPVTCVYADDDPFVRELVTFNLEAEGVSVHTCSSGIGIEEIVEEVRPDLVMLDVMMPGRDGYSVLRSLKSSQETRDIPVVLLSAKASDAEIWQGWQAGADYYLTKPFRVDQLVGYLHLIAQKRSGTATTRPGGPGD